MFIDDTGNVRSDVSNHPQKRYAGIIGVIFELDYLRNTFEPGFKELKRRHFSRPDTDALPILHLRKMKNTDARSPFFCLSDPVRRAAWERDVFSMYCRASYTVIAVCVDKIAFYYQNPRWQGSFYDLLIGNAIERYFYFLRGHGTGDVMIEATHSDLDREVKDLYRRFYDSGAEHISSANLRAVLTTAEIKIKPKSKDIPGLQMADLLASTCFSHLLRLYAGGPEFDPFAMSVADLLEREKFYRDPTGNPHRYGRVWRPQGPA